MDSMIAWLVGDLEILPEIMVVLKLGLLDCAFTLLGLFFYCFKNM